MRMILSALIFSAFSTMSFAGEGSGCRLLMRGYDSLVGDNSELQASINKAFSKKGIELIDESELRQGDFTSNLLKRFADYRGLPLHKYMMSKKRRLMLVPCTAVPLCSPIGMDQEVTSIDGIKYNDQFRISLVTESGEVSVLEKSFKHTYRGETTDPRGEAYMGSPEQADLALAVARRAPDCKTLMKSSREEGI